jgi:hypothetical protein
VSEGRHKAHKVRTIANLMKKKVAFFRTSNKRGPQGFGTGKVIQIKTDRKGNITKVRVRCPRGRIWVTWAELTCKNHPVGVMWFGKIRPIHEWLGKHQ